MNQAPITSLGRIVWVPRITATTRTVPRRGDDLMRVVCG
jgi:hypothetical protein